MSAHVAQSHGDFDFYSVTWLIEEHFHLEAEELETDD